MKKVKIKTTQNASADINPDDVKVVIEKTIKIIRDWLK